jgi:hypothetical protein
VVHFVPVLAGRDICDGNLICNRSAEVSIGAAGMISTSEKQIGHGSARISTDHLFLIRVHP